MGEVTHMQARDWGARCAAPPWARLESGMGEARANCGGEDVAGAHAEDDVLDCDLCFRNGTQLSCQDV